MVYWGLSSFVANHVRCVSLFCLTLSWIYYLWCSLLPLFGACNIWGCCSCGFFSIISDIIIFNFFFNIYFTWLVCLLWCLIIATRSMRFSLRSTITYYWIISNLLLLLLGWLLWCFTTSTYSIISYSSLPWTSLYYTSRCSCLFRLYAAWRTTTYLLLLSSSMYSSSNSNFLLKVVNSFISHVKVLLKMSISLFTLFL